MLALTMILLGVPDLVAFTLALHCFLVPDLIPGAFAYLLGGHPSFIALASALLEVLVPYFISLAAAFVIIYEEDFSLRALALLGLLIPDLLPLANAGLGINVEDFISFALAVALGVSHLPRSARALSSKFVNNFGRVHTSTVTSLRVFNLTFRTFADSSLLVQNPGLFNTLTGLKDGIPDGVCGAETGLLILIPVLREFACYATFTTLEGSRGVAYADIFLLVEGHVRRATIAFLCLKVVVLMGVAKSSTGARRGVPELIMGALDALMILGVMVSNCAFFALPVGDRLLPPGLVAGALYADFVLLVFVLVGTITVVTMRLKQKLTLSTSREVKLLKSLGRNNEQ